MKRIDRLLGEARLLRIRRAARARGMLPPDPAHNWFDECGTAQIILSDLAETGTQAVADPRRTAPISVLDLTALAPFVARVREAVQAVIAEMEPDAALAAEVWSRARPLFDQGEVGDRKGGTPSIYGADGTDGADDADGMDGDDGEPRSKVEDQGSGDGARTGRGDPDRPRRAACSDVAALAVESVLFEVVRQVIASRDAARPVSPRSDPASIVVEGGRVRRKRPPKAILNANERISAALGGSLVPEAVGRSTGRLGPVEEAARRAARRAAKANGTKADEVKADAAKVDGAEANGNGVAKAARTRNGKVAGKAQGKESSGRANAGRSGAKASSPAFRQGGAS